MTDAAPPQLTLDWLEIRKFRNVEPCRLEFGKGHNVILGLNGTGKTQLLELIGALSSVRLQALLDEDFDLDLSWGLLVGDESLSIDAVFSARGSKPRTLQFSIAHNSGPNGSPRVWSPNGEIDATARQVLEDPLVEDRRPEIQQLRARILPRIHPRFDEALRYFDHFTRRDADAPPALTVEHHADDTGSIEYARHVDPAFLWSFEPVAVPIEPEHRIADPAVQRFGELADYVGAGVLRRRSTSSVQGGVRVEFWNPEYEFTRGRSIIAHSALSFGERRLLAFLYYAAVAQGVAPQLSLPIIADELTNGLHRAWVDACFDVMEGRQTFLATQSPLLLDRIWVDSPEHAKHAFVVCRRVGTPDDTRLSWQQLDDAQAQAVFEAFERRTVHMSEILHFENLW